MKKSILITGGAGFIGSHVVRLFVQNYPDYKIVNLDSLTYAGNLENIADIEILENYEFVKGDIRDADFIFQLFEKYNFDSVDLYTSKRFENVDVQFGELKPGISSFEIVFGKTTLQIRVKPMNKFTAPALKVNCSVKVKGRNS